MAHQRITYCRICEAHCGLVVTVDRDEVVSIRPDKDHPLSQGEACPKGIAMTEIQNDPDRVIHPLRRDRASGEFTRVSWESALTEIASRLEESIAAGGKDSVAWYFGNPGAFSYSHAIWAKGFLDGVGSPHYYTASSQDVSNRFAASAMLYGSPAVIPIPDLTRTSLLLMIGANPFVSHGSLIAAPRIKTHLHAIVERGGRVVCVDPRRTETARHFEHLPIRPDSDAWMLLSLLCVLAEEGLCDDARIAGQSLGWPELREVALRHPPEETEARTSIPAETVRQLARDLAAAPGAAVYGRTGSCLGRHGTLVAHLIDAVNVVTGNLDRPGGAVFGHPAIALEEMASRAGLDTYGKVRSRIGDFPDVLGALPASLMADEMTTPGKGQIRSLFTSAGNPVLSCPDGPKLEAALETLDLHVSLDLYVTETNRHADFILPATTWLERDDLPVALLSFYAVPFVQYSDPVVPPRGEAREEWQIIDDLARRIGIQPYGHAAARLAARLKIKLSPRTMIDLLLRTGPYGDWFGLRRRGLSLGALRRRPSGVVLEKHVPTGVLGKRIRHRDRRVRLADPRVLDAARRLEGEPPASREYPLLLIGMRELRSHNSWMHNAPLLMRGGREQPLRVAPVDAERLAVGDGDIVRLVSKVASVEVPVRVTDEMMSGVVALPHGWGHRGGWRTANDAGGVNVNLLMSAAPEDLEPLAGMANLNGVPVRLEVVCRRRDAEAALASARGGHA
ncbi:MAG: molybdopterin-dependent oxidoreductase [Baekduia sp.]